MKKIFITESQLNHLLLEAVMPLQDIYQKYYSNIPQNVFSQIIIADPTYNKQKGDKIGKYGKWLLSLYTKNHLKLEDLYKATEYLTYFVKYINKIQVKDINKYTSLPSLYNVVKEFIDNPNASTSNSDEARKAKEGAEKAYEDDKWLIVIPKTYEASCYYGANTQWCTASNKTRQNFNQYTSEGPLFINIDKKTNTKYQFHFESDSFMDENDSAIQETPIYEQIGLYGNALKYYEESLPEEQYLKLVQYKKELYSNDYIGVLYACSTPVKKTTWIYSEYEDRIICDDLKMFNVDSTSEQMIEYGYALIPNIYGYKSLITVYENSAQLISNCVTNALHISEVFGNFYHYDHYIIEYRDIKGIYKLYDFANEEYVYKTPQNEIDDYNTLPYSNIIYYKKTDGTYDLVDIDYGNVPLLGLKPYNMNTGDDYIIMYDEQGRNLIKISLEDMSYEDYNEDNNN